MVKSYWNHALVWASLAGALTGCSTVPEHSAPAGPPATEPPASAQNGGKDPVLQLEPPSRSGNADSYVVFGRRYRVKETSEGYREQGTASWYGKDFHGRKTSSGPRYNMFDLTAAHKSLPIPTYVRVSNLTNGRDVVVKVTDRGPFVGNRLIDLSYTAAERLGMLGKGTAQVEVTALEPYQVLPKLAARRAEAKERLADPPPQGQSNPESATISTAREKPNRPAEPAASRAELTAVRAEMPPQPDRPTQPAANTEPSALQLAYTEPRPPETPAIVRAETPPQPDRPTQPAANTELSALQRTLAEPRRSETPVLDVPAPRQAAESEAAVKRTPAVARSRIQPRARLAAEPLAPAKSKLLAVGRPDGGQSEPHSTGTNSLGSRKASNSAKRVEPRPFREAGALKPVVARLAGVKMNRSRSAGD